MVCDRALRIIVDHDWRRYRRRSRYSTDTATVRWRINRAKADSSVMDAAVQSKFVRVDQRTALYGDWVDWSRPEDYECFSAKTKPMRENGATIAPYTGQSIRKPEHCLGFAAPQPPMAFRRKRERRPNHRNPAPTSAETRQESTAQDRRHEAADHHVGREEQRNERDRHDVAGPQGAEIHELIRNGGLSFRSAGLCANAPGGGRQCGDSRPRRDPSRCGQVWRWCSRRARASG